MSGKDPPMEPEDVKNQEHALAELMKLFVAAEALLWDLKVEDIEIVNQLRLMVTTARARILLDPEPLTPRLIKNDAEHDAALAEVDRLMALNPAIGSADGDRLELYATLIVIYEKVRYPLRDPTPEEAAAFRADQEGRQALDGYAVHHLHQGAAACAGVTAALRRLPKYWPAGHGWSRDWGDVTCLACLLHAPGDDE